MSDKLLVSVAIKELVLKSSNQYEIRVESHPEPIRVPLKETTHTILVPRWLAEDRNLEILAEHQEIVKDEQGDRDRWDRFAAAALTGLLQSGIEVRDAVWQASEIAGRMYTME